jgi:HlyD family secretion protein
MARKSSYDTSDLRNAATAEAAAAARPFDRVRGRVITGTVLCIALFTAIGGWATTAKLTGAVIAAGTVKVDENIKQVQHRDGGIIAEIRVREGEEVAAGQVMFRLDDAQSKAELSILRAQLDEAEARRARLQSDRDGNDAIIFPAHLVPPDQPLSDLVAGEVRLHAGTLANRANQRQQLELGIHQIEDEIAGLSAQRAALEEEISLVEGTHVRLRDLAARGLVEAGRTDAMARDSAQLRGRLGELDASIARSHARISEMRVRILAVDDLARTEALRELGATETRILELTDRIAAVTDRLSRTEIRAPISGRINELTVFTIGGVITPAEVLATIVPADARLRIEARLPPTSVDQVYTDQKARVRFSSFNHRTTPELIGAVRYVAPATSVDAGTGEAYYVGHIELLPGEAEKLGDLALLPGMPAEIYIETIEQTAAAYFGKPLTDQFARAFREE